MRCVLLSVVLLLGLGACTSTPEPTDTPAPAEETSPPAPAQETSPPEPVVALDTAAVAPLRSYLSDSLVLATAQYIQTFKQATTGDALAATYEQAKTLTIAINNTLDIPYETVYVWVDSLNQTVSLPGLAASCVAECTEAVLAVRYSDFARQAGQTPAGIDDTFFAFMQEIYWDDVAFLGGHPDAFPAWYEQTWDYGGSSLLGDSLHLSFLQQIEQIQQATPHFTGDLQQVRAAILDDILGTHGACTTYINPVAPIQAEIQAILQQVALTEAEQAQLIDRRAAFEDLAAHQIEVDCRAGSCVCGQG